MTNMSAPRFTDETAAREHLEALRWPNGPVCPHCGSFDASRLPTQRGKPSKAHPQGKERKGILQCNGCRQQFTVIVGTVFSDSKVPLHKWLLANHLLVSSKKGISSHQLHRMLGVTYKTAWFMAHRIREAMNGNGSDKFGSGGGIVEADETFIGVEPDAPAHVRRSVHHKMKVLALVDRSTGQSRSFVIDRINIATITPIVLRNMDRGGRLATDEAPHYRFAGQQVRAHRAVNHSKGNTCAATCTPTRSRAISASSSEA